MRESVGIVISPVWPGNDRGYRIAVRSSLREYAAVFDRIYFVAVSEEGRSSSDPLPSNVEWIHVPVVRRQKWIRFMLGVVAGQPGIVMQFRNRNVRRSLAGKLRRIGLSGRPTGILFEDVPVASLFSDVKRLFPATPVAVRTHNIHVEAFEDFATEGHILKRWPWRLEVSRIARLEEMTLRMADLVWTISARDAEETRRRYGIGVDGVLGITMDHRRYSEVAPGAVSTVVSIGTADLRKAHGLARFVSKTWPTVATTCEKAQLLLAGRGTETFTESKTRVTGLGYIDDDRLLLEKGQIFVNPQERGSGVKLKSITAMLAGKTLVSTKKGVEGVAGKAGEHFFVADNGREMAQIILRLVSDHEDCLRIGQKGKEMAIARYGEAGSETRNTRLFASILSS